MSDTGTPERTVAEDGITLTKSYAAEEFPVPTVDFRLRSERDDGAMVRLVDAIPDGVPSEDLGFHPDYGGDDWTVEGDSAVFERHIGPGEECRTIYGVRTDDHDPERLMTDPTLAVSGLGDGATAEAADAGGASTATEPDEPTAAPGRDSSQAARDVIAGDRDVAGLDSDDTAEAVDISGAEPGATGGTETSAAAGGTDAASGERASGGAGGVPAGEVGAALATELRNGNLSAADRELLAEELDTDGASGEIRLTHLQSRISDLEAYTDALEAFIDENGSARKLIENLTEQVESIEDELDDLDERTSANETDIGRLDGHTEANAEDIDALEEGIADAQSDIGETQSAIEDLREDIAEINGWRTQISTVLGGTPESDTDQS